MRRRTYAHNPRRPCTNSSQVPAEFRREVNTLLAMYDSLPANGGATAATLLATRQKKYKTEVEAATRTAGRHGLRKKPTSAVEVGLLQLEESKKLRHVIEGLLDVARAVVRTLAYRVFPARCGCFC